MDYKFFALAIQYFCLARVGGEYIFNPASGNLYHLSIELLLKAYLLSSISSKDLQYKYGHNLIKLWKEFKTKTSDANLDKYDLYIKNLDVWERVRYITLPNDTNAAAIELRKGHAPKEYLDEIAKLDKHKHTWLSLYLDDMDELFQAIIFATKIDIQSLLVNQFDMIQGVEIYEKGNKYSIFKRS